MELVLSQVYSLDSIVSRLPTCWVFATVQTTGYLETFGGRHARDQINDRLIIAKRLAASIRADEREQSVLNLVPLTGAWRKMTHGDR
jgi:hypothetical protein